MGKRDKIIYALYKGDEFIDLGTKKELANKYNIKEHTIVFYASPAYKRRIKDSKNRYVCEKVELEEGEE